MWAGNAAHAAMRFANVALSKSKGGEPKRKQAGATSLKTRLTMAMDYTGNVHRAFWIPFTDLNFAPQVANELLARDYPAPERLWRERRGSD